MTTRRYHDGETDAIVRRFRRYLNLIDDGDTPADRKKHLTAVITEDFRALDEFLSCGRPLPSQWMKGRNVVKVAGQIATAPVGKETSAKKEGK